MKIALDFDDTYTRDPTLWDSFIDQAKSQGHDIRIVTYRPDNERNGDLEQAIHGRIPVIYTGGRRKRLHCYELGFMVHVWIDDMPEIIVEDTFNEPVNLIRIVNEENI